MHKNKNINFISHLLVWVFLFTMPMVLSNGQDDTNRIIIHFWIPLVFYAFTFYVNYFFLIDKYLSSPKIWLQVKNDFKLIIYIPYLVF
jgi:hypothetical protein